MAFSPQEDPMDDITQTVTATLDTAQADTANANSQQSLIVEEMLVEELSIDGMCGVY
jgi:mycofactocin precursor